MRKVNRKDAETFLRSQGLSANGVAQTLGGFDFDRPAYIQDFWPGDTIYQLVRNPSFETPLPSVGNWFGLAGITTASVAINDGISGRWLAKFEVTVPFKALEGTAAKLHTDVGRAIGGTGGGTQIFIPSMLRGYLKPLGAADRWP